MLWGVEMDKIAIVDVKPQLILGMRKIGGYEEIAPMIQKLCEFAASKNIEMIGPPIFVCHEITVEEAMEAYEQKNADVEVAIPILKCIERTDEAKCYELPGGKMANIVHKGPYEDCTSTYEKLYAWLEDKHKKLVGPTREIYLNDPREVSPEEILTDIYAPIE